MVVQQNLSVCDFFMYKRSVCVCVCALFNRTKGSPVVLPEDQSAALQLCCLRTLMTTRHLSTHTPNYGPKYVEYVE